MEISKRFQFDAAHFMPHAPDGHPYRQVHGHSFEAELTLVGEPAETTGWIIDFDEIEQQIAAVRERLDHRLLNDIAGLETPTLERLTDWLWNELSTRLPGLSRICVSRPSIGQSCTRHAER